MWTRRLVLLALVPLPCFWMASGQCQGTSPGVSADCPKIAGEYSFSGTVVVDGKEEPITFLQRLVRPNRPGVQWISVKEPTGVGDLTISLLDRADKVVGNDVRRIAHCVSGTWEVVHPYEGNSDGTSVRGTKTWRYFRSDKGELVVEFSLSAEVRYFPGLTSPREVRNRANFRQR